MHNKVLSFAGIVLGFAFVFSVSADIAVTVDARKDLQLTVYRDFGVVKDIRKVNLPEGANRIRFEGVATEINAETVTLDWKSGSGIELIAQSYEFDLVNPQKLMEKYVGREIEIVPRKDQWPDTSQRTAELISINGKEPVYRIGTQITFGDIGRVLFPYMPDNLYTRPTLLWNVYISKRQETEIVATYLTEGFSWKAGYFLQIDKRGDTGSFGGWITFTNRSGLDCKNTQITFVAGDVPRMCDKQSYSQSAAAHGEHCDAGQSGEYSFYAMAQRVTIFTNRASQVEWIPRTAVKLKQSFVAEVNPDDGSGMDTPVTVCSSVEVENSQSNGLGLPLPDGIVRISRRDADDNARFIGERPMNDTKAGGSFYLPVGRAGGVSVLRKPLAGGESYQLEVKNDRDKAVTVKVVMHTGGRRIIDSSVKYRMTQESSLEWDVVVKSHETVKIAYSLQKKGK